MKFNESQFSEVPYSDQKLKRISIERDWNSNNRYSEELNRILKIIIANHFSRNENAEITISAELWPTNPLFDLSEK